APVVENLAKRCGGFLKRLSLRGCENVQENALRSFTLKCPNIEHLSLYKCKRVTDSEGCKNLEYLNISWCENVQNRGVQAVLQGCPKLSTLICRGCEGLTETAFAEMRNFCCQLRTVNLLGCFITDDTVANLAAGLPKIGVPVLIFLYPNY
uniref:F-box/LRR-repeat protein 20 n=1 Tax=Loa loa TaxID=7209 RepID=A0A1I7VU58_LOALO